MAGTLFVVATPIGNLEDVTLRALRVLADVDLIAAEDTRRTAKLLARHGITTRTLSFHQHNVRTRLPELLTRLEAGGSVAVVTDAGTPGISDPGAELVQACVEAGIVIDPVPGVSAPLAAAVASGFPLIPLTILGFPPRRLNDRMSWISKLSRINHTVTFFESPLRIARTLAEAGPALVDRPIVVGRELTKLHQVFYRGTATSLASSVANKKGEITVVVGPRIPDLRRSYDQLVPLSPESVSARFVQLTETAGVTRRDAIVLTAKEFDRPPKEIYSLVEKAKRSGK